MEQCGNIVSSASDAGRELEELLDSSTKRNAGREATNAIATVPSALEGDDMQDGEAPESFRLSSPHKNYTAASGARDHQCPPITKYRELSDEAKHLDKMLYPTLLASVGPVRKSVLDVHYLPQARGRSEAP